MTVSGTGVSIPRRMPSRVIWRAEEAPSQPLSLPVTTSIPTAVFIPTIYGNSQKYGTVLYGGQWVALASPNIIPPQMFPPGTPQQIPAGYNIGPFTAQAVDYTTLMITWTTPAGPFVDFRLVRSRFGFPIDQNDGTVLLDSVSGGGYPGSQYFDSQVIPGTYHYYGIYILIQLQGQQVWYRAGLTSVLAVANLNSTSWLMSRLPELYKVINTSDLTTATPTSPTPVSTAADPLGNPYIAQFMSIFGWGADFLQTQLAIAANVNNAATIPVNWLANLAGTLGFPFYPEIPAGTLRAAITNQAALIKERGTLNGIEAMITQLTGWGADIRVGYNQLLEEDQSRFTDPLYPAWSSLISYSNAEQVTYQGYDFVSTGNNNLNNAPFINTNPYFSAGILTGWAGFGGTITATQAITGGPQTWSVQLVSSSAPGAVAGFTAPFAVSPNTSYSVNAWVFSAGGFTAQIGFDWDSGAGVFANTVTNNFAVPGGTWTHLSTTLTSPANAAFAYPRVGCTASGVTMYVQAVLVTTSSTVWWNEIYYQANAAQLANPATGWLNTWEPLIDTMVSQHPTNASALTELVGIQAPSFPQRYDHNGLAVTNNSGAASAIELRSVSRTPADITAGLAVPNRDQVIRDGLPVPYTLPSQVWSPSVFYLTGSVAIFQGSPFLALKASQGSAPPSNGIPTNEWAPVGYDNRIALMMSAYSSQNLTKVTSQTFAITPYVQWFDMTGALITQLSVRPPALGGVFGTSSPPNIVYDSFSLPSAWGRLLQNTAPDIGSYTWQVTSGSFQVNAFMGGTAIPSGFPGQSIAVVNYGSASAFVGVTLSSLAPAGWANGLVLRWASNTSYIRVDQNYIVTNNGTVSTTLATHSTPFLPLDRMTASCNGNVITVFRNGIQVSQVTTTFNSSATFFGIVTDNQNIITLGTVGKGIFVYRRSRAKISNSNDAWIGPSSLSMGGIRATTNASGGSGTVMPKAILSAMRRSRRRILGLQTVDPVSGQHQRPG